MKMVLENARKTYQGKYEEFFEKIQQDSEEVEATLFIPSTMLIQVLKLYEETHGEGKNEKEIICKEKLLELERSRANDEKITELTNSLRDLNGNILVKEQEVTSMHGEFNTKVTSYSFIG